MYMGLIKRGLAAMSGFFLLIYLLVASSSGRTQGLFAFAIPILILTCIFDGFNIRRRINAGEVVEDGISEILSGLFRNKALTIALLAIIAITFAGRILGFVGTIVSSALPILLIGFGLYVILRRKKSTP